MALTYQDYINFLSTSKVFVLYAQFSFLNSDETIYQIFNADVTGGTLTVNRANGTRRTISINVSNITNKYTPNPLTFWINQKFKLSLGYLVNGEVYYIEQGVFALRNPTTLHESSDKSATISGIDKFALLDGALGGRLSGTYSIPLGTSVRTAIASTLALGNDPTSPLLAIDPAITTPYTIYCEYGKSYADILLELNNIISYNMYYDLSGVFHCEPDIDNAVKGSQFDFDTKSAIYQGINQTFDFENAFNIVVVIGDNINGDIATGTAKNNDPSSPLSVLNIGEKLAPIITDAVIDTDVRAQDRANYEIKRYASLGVEASITCIPILHLDVDQFITVTDELELLDRERFLINSITMPLSPQSGQLMNIDASKGSYLDFEITTN